MTMHLFSNYDEWRRTITCVGPLEMTRSYFDQRRRALAGEGVPAARDFVKAYGPTYRDHANLWFRKAGEEVSK